MILKGSQRGGAKQLGLHLLKTVENEHVEIYDVRGFMTDDVVGALREAEAVSKGTKCRQFLFSVSLNPPEIESVRIETFEQAITAIEEKHGLTDQPRVIVFHEKEGRRHCHAVWSRIDAETMTAKPLPFFKNKLMEVSKQLYLEHGWQMPRGLANNKDRDLRAIPGKRGFMGVPQTKAEPTVAIIYCRVSSVKQRTSGAGLDSQEHRCRQYAEQKGYSVEAVFPDDVSGGGDFMQRPGMRAMLAYLDAQKGRQYTVIFDDLKRFARDTEFHIKLRREFAELGASIECLNFNFEDTPEGRFIETIIAAQGQLEREQNKRQVVQKMRARIEKGYYVFHPPIGYRYSKDRMHGKLLVRDEPIASILAEALEGFASGRFGSQVEVKRFLESKPDFPKSGKTNYVHPSKVKDILQRPVYAGYVEAPDWGVSLRKGHHEPLISFSTFERVQAVLSGKVYAPARKDISEDFPLRGFVCCDDCGEPLTSCWSKGRNKHYPYYLCDTPKCPSKRKSIPRAKIESGAAEVLRSLQPAKQMFAMAQAMFADAWKMRLKQAHTAKDTLATQIKDIDEQIEVLLDRVVDASGESLVRAYEAKVEKLEKQKLLLADQAAQAVPPKGRFDDFIEHTMTFLASPWNIYENGGIALRRTVLKLAFAEPLSYNRESGYRTAKTTFPFKVLAGISTQKCEMVGDPGIEPGVRLREGVTVPCHTLRPVAH